MDERTYDGMETGESGTDGETSETGLGNGAVDDSFVAEAVEEAFRDLVPVIVEWSVGLLPESG